MTKCCICETPMKFLGEPQGKRIRVYWCPECGTLFLEDNDLDNTWHYPSHAKQSSST